MVEPSRALVALYWGPRPWSVDASAAILLEVLSALKSAGFEQFRRKGVSRKEADASHFEPSLAAAALLLSRGVNRRDVGGQPLNELGFMFGLWSGGRSEEAYELTGQFGATSHVATNNLLLGLPATGPHSLAQSEPSIRLLFGNLVAILSPVDAIVCASGAIRWHNRRLAADIPCLMRHGA